MHRCNLITLYVAANFDYSVSAGFAERLFGLGLSLAFSSRQAGILCMVGAKSDGGVNFHQAAVPHLMSIHSHGRNKLSLGARDHILHLQNVVPNDRVAGFADAAFVSRESEFTDSPELYDLGIDADGRAIFVNTRYNCLATPANLGGFREVWRPSFITALIAEDRCHLTGLAMQDGRPRYVTAASQSDTRDGWRDQCSDGGIVIDVTTGDVVCDGLSIPHSPRLYDGRLWLLNSGRGELGTVEFDGDGKGHFEPHVLCPGIARGLAIHCRYAFVGLSKPRYSRFEGLALDASLTDTDNASWVDSTSWCGVQIIDLDTKSCVDWLRIDGAVTELTDLELLHGHLCPMAVAPGAPEAANLITMPNSA